MGLREIESTLPPGFRFYPSDEELVCHYLYKKVTNNVRASQQGTLVEVDLHAREPWELPEVAKLTASEWYFFSFRDRKYATGSRTNRATKTGYWKATGKDREVRSPASRAVVGMRKTLVFYQGRAPNGVKSGWVMHEFRLDSPHSPPKEDWVLCRVFQKRKGDGELLQDTTCSSMTSPTFAGGASSQLAAYNVDSDLHQTAGSSMAGFVPRQDDIIIDSSNQQLLNLAMSFQCSSVLDQFQQAEVNSSPMMGLESSIGIGDEYGFFYDTGCFEETANLGPMRPPRKFKPRGAFGPSYLEDRPQLAKFFRVLKYFEVNIRRLSLGRYKALQLRITRSLRRSTPSEAEVPASKADLARQALWLGEGGGPSEARGLLHSLGPSKAPEVTAKLRGRQPKASPSVGLRRPSESRRLLLRGGCTPRREAFATLLDPPLGRSSK
ncbi:hypothetical protein GUJ93_ZPchr0014g46928 [Zizania palustris]|uniref:NAC domain-containing protein n=1 Tax=Zizania palustris TaxID=103762 RepID=A0A8J5TFL5_ZIZPA|nr:hypothetical protein GUJ93_ZPchr0014g46928 [Zizania palustris]